MSAKWHKYVPYAFLALFAIMRLPGFNTQGFSLAYALVFCAGAYPRLLHIGWVIGVIAVSDLWLNAYYESPFTNEQFFNYLAYAGLYFLGRQCRKQTSIWRMIGGGFLGALIFYIVTNTGSWLSEPRYAKSLLGWWQALTIGLPEWPQSWTFFRNTLLSGGLFSGAMAALLNALQPAEMEPEEAEETEEVPDVVPDEEKSGA
jgi:hypothetical protein